MKSNSSADFQNGSKEKKMKVAMNKKSVMQAVKRRRHTVEKNLWDLATLCDVDVCMIAVEPNGEIQLLSNDDPEKARDIIMHYRRHKGRSSDRNSDHTSVDYDHPQQDLEPLSLESLMGWTRTLDDQIQRMEERIDQLVRKDQVNIMTNAVDRKDDVLLLPHHHDQTTNYDDYKETDYVFDNFDDLGQLEPLINIDFRSWSTDLMAVNPSFDTDQLPIFDHTDYVDSFLGVARVPVLEDVLPLQVWELH